jgi:hypothetical protein
MISSHVAVLALSLAADPSFQRVQLDAVFRAEGVAVGDFNKDGLSDVAAGDVWFAAPDWQRHEFRPMLDRAGKPTDKYDGNTGYSNCFASWAYDVNQDGWDDILVVGFPGAPCFWCENPQNAPGHWKQHVIWHSACNETPLFTDVTGDDRPDLILGSQPERQMGFLEVPPPEKCRDKWTFHAISEAGEPAKNGTFMYYHGLGAGDVNSDGRLDVMIPHGWWEAPEQRTSGLWQFHPWSLSKNNQGNPLPAANLFAIDLDLDGDNDIVMSCAHQYGVWWFENPGGDFTGDFKYHLIDESFSQSHALALVDLQGDGVPTFVTGKRYYAHNGKLDPGENEPVVMMTYGVLRERGQPPRFERQEIDAGKDTGIGTQFQIADIDRNGTLDLILSNKKGVNLLLQKPARVSLRIPK